MSSPFLGVYTAIYDYQAQNDEELSLTENDILYLLEKSDFDDWWKVKKRVLDANLEEPQGLVPATYIKPAEIASTAIALFDYTKQTEEELSFNEGSSLNVYDTSDPNWTLVNINNQQFGFVPANYIQINSSNNLSSINPTPFPVPNSVNSPTSTIPTPTPTPGLQYFPPPPQRSNKLSPSNQIDNAINNITDDENIHNNNDDSELPPMPSRPTTTTSVSKANHQNNNGSHSRFDNYSDDYSDDNYGDDNDNHNNQSDKQKNESKSFFSPSRTKLNTRSRSNTANSKISRKKSISNFLLGSSNDNNNNNTGDTVEPVNGDFAWKVHEIDGKKKRKGRLEIGDGKIYLDIDNKLSEEWLISNLTNYNSEKKHVFLDFKNPSYSFELHVGNKESAQAIISILGDIKGMTSLTALDDVKNATRDGKLEAAKKKGTILFDFNAVAEDELNCNEGDFVYIINDKKSKDWWMVENKKGERGVVPSNFIKVVGDKEFDDKSGKKSKDSGFMKSLFGTSGNKSPKKKSSKDRDREERELREMARLQREKDELEKQKRRQDRKEKELMMMDREQRERLRRADDRLREKRMKKEMEKSSKSSTSKESSKPNTHRVRTWIDRSGTFKVEAEFIGIQEGKIHLHKLNGVKIAVAAQKLSSEDLEYVEKLTGMSLENYKQKTKSKSREPEQQQQQQQQQSQPSLPSRENSSAIQRKKAIPYNTELIDYWFNFFVESNVDVNVCERYATNFASEQMDKSILEEITPALMRTLGIKEGDILKVKKHLDAMFNRYVSPEPVTNPSSAVAAFTSSESFSKPSSLSNDDEAWTVKPASKTTGDNLVPQITGSIKDLLDVKPMQATKTGITPVKPINTIPATTTGSLPLLQQKTSSLPSQQTGAPLMAMPTGFMPITMVPMMTGIAGQPTGFMPMRTGGLTGGLSMPLTSFNQQSQQKTGGYMLPLNTGMNNMPMASFGMGAQPTGGLVKLQPTGVILNKTGGADLLPTMQPTMKTGGGFMPQTSFGMQLTGAVNGFNSMPTNSFGIQAPLNNAFTGGIPPVMTGGFPMTSFGTGVPQMTGAGMQDFGSAAPINNAYTGGLPPAITGNMGSMPMTSFGAPISQINGGLPMTSFGNGMSAAMTGGMGGMPVTSFGANNQMNQMTNMFNQASLNPQPQFHQQQQQQQIQMQQQQQQPTLQPQPTGLGFGNGPIVSGIPGGKQANLANATADNPFGF